MIDNNFREYALVKTEQELVDVLENDEDKDRFVTEKIETTVDIRDDHI